MKTGEVRAIFDDLKRELVPLIKEIAEAGEIDDSFLHGKFDPARQREFSLHVLGRFGFTDDEWRLDTTPHPFMCSPGAHDVRLTTNFRPNNLTSIFATMHEFGHGVYEWGVAPELHRTPLGTGVSLAVHESQSRSWENLVGRSRAFWRHFYPQLQETFPQFGAVDEQMERGEFGEIREWLRSHLYVLGRKYTPQETIERVTGSRIDAVPYVRYLREKLAPQPA